jgi:DNA polymerase-3 subunit epsilon
VAIAGALQAAAGPIAHGPRPRPLAPRSTEAERAAHAAFVGGVLKDKAIWIKFGVEPG